MPFHPACKSATGAVSSKATAKSISTSSTKNRNFAKTSLPHSHKFLSDHYAGLGKKFQGSPIFCSGITAKLCQLQLNIPGHILYPLVLNTWICISDILNQATSSAEDWINKVIPPKIDVLLMDANHCPGAVMFLFKIEDISNRIIKHILHTGDFRACPDTILSSPFLLPFLHDGHEKLDIVYLDTTYGNEESYSFPSQKKALSALSAELSKIVIRENRQRLVPISYLIVVGTYMVGKEKVCLEIASLLSSRIWCSSIRKKPLLDVIFPEEFLGEDPLACQVHLVSMSDLTDESLSLMLDKYRPHYTHIIAIKPTGWTFKNSFSKLKPIETNPRSIVTNIMKKGTLPRHKGRIMLLEVPYSEHSSYEELKIFLSTFKIDLVIPTVPISFQEENISKFFP